MAQVLEYVPDWFFTEEMCEESVTEDTKDELSSYHSRKKQKVRIFIENYSLQPGIQIVTGIGVWTKTKKM